MSLEHFLPLSSVTFFSSTPSSISMAGSSSFTELLNVGMVEKIGIMVCS